MILLRTLVFMSVWLVVHPASISYMTGLTNVIGEGGNITRGTSPFSSASIISSISPAFDPYGLTNIKVCYKKLISRQGGAVYDTNTAENCTSYGSGDQPTPSNKFSADEWPPCLSSLGYIVYINISTNLGNYWIGGNTSAECKKTNFEYVAPKSFSIAIYGLGIGNRLTSPPGIGSLQLNYVYCPTGNTCPAGIYNGGGLCGIRNGGCDIGVNCVNAKPSPICSQCPLGYSPDSLNVCRVQKGSPSYCNLAQTYDLNPQGGGTLQAPKPPILPPFKLCRIFGQIHSTNAGPSSVLLSFNVSFAKVVNGIYDKSTTQTLASNGYGVNYAYSDNRAYPFDFNLTEGEWITDIQTCIVNWSSNSNKEIAQIDITTNQRSLQAAGDFNGTCASTAVISLSQQQILTSFNVRTGEVLDSVIFSAANCSENCTADRYVSGICATSSIVCPLGSYCEDTSTSYTCTCYPEYTKTGNLCLPTTDYCQSGFCAQEVNCTLNTGPFGYDCGPCPSGFTGSGYTQCQDVDECLSSPCDPYAECTNTPGSFTCNCTSGFIGTGLRCKDVNECIIQHGGCSHDAYCNNTIGNRTCTCHEGYTGDGIRCRPVCGDGRCNRQDGENCVTCPQDCPNSPCGVCGDSVCVAAIGETCSTCPNDCGLCKPKSCGKSACNGHGTCYDGICACVDGWTGPSCNSLTHPIEVEFNSTSPGASITSNQLTFQIAIIQLVEYNTQNQIVQEIDFQGLNFTFTQNSQNNTNSSNVEWLFSTRFDNGAMLDITIWQLEDPTTNFLFGGSVLSFPQHTLKLNFKVTSWPFYAISNSLGIVMTNSGGSAETSSCSGVDSQNGDLRWFAISYNDTTFRGDGFTLYWTREDIFDSKRYGQFLSYAVLDGNVRNITYTSSNASIVTAIVQHFWQTAEVDPNFVVLLGRHDDFCSSSNKSKFNKMLYIAIFAPVGVAILLLVLFIAAYPKFSTWRKLQQARSNDSELSSIK